VALIAATLPLLLAAPSQATTGTGTIAGTAFEDDDRNGVVNGAEAVLAGHQIYVNDALGRYVSQATTGADGRYQVSGLPAGDYQLAYASTSWWPLQQDWVPTTTGSIRPRRSVSLSDTARVDFGWRRIIRSTTPGSPITAHTGPEGLRAESYNDAVTAHGRRRRS
jgi:hypothetical protein